MSSKNGAGTAGVSWLQVATRKNPAAVQLGKLRTKKGPPLDEIGSLGGKRRAERLSKKDREASASNAGKASAQKLTPEERRQRAKMAAQARWKNK